MILPRLTCLFVCIALAACGGKDKDVVLAKIKKKGDGPDEFSIIPGKALQEPEDYTLLPKPTPGNINLTDQTPKIDGIIALGGTPPQSGIAKTETSLVAHVGQFNAPTNIRQTIATEDKELRRRYGNVNIFKFGGAGNYNAAYRKHWLNGYSEQERLSQRNVQTPTAPPEP